ncbi:molybdopterin-guanine dinucleotide biosynthesis protein B [Paenibacillus sp. OV219]|uniref:molybdopterin-guanine dinucleotide biosynthesis protein B n=1 Tax=Paenibacillus sp. OV219 TaxID=1884377 RepID=UPI0008C19123|nr:molybdopterin-guanine dinucleotide biosynthesis protein B [Paenibacillus sp. OV219]SEO90390.1 molybdopterin-guanine dinucleotide biosynthesis protein B [Paenibacillus sp. OV219]
MSSDQNSYHSVPAQSQQAPFVFQIVGYKNSGKTTLLSQLTRKLKQAGFTVGTAKHDAHEFTMDTPGTDTWQHQEAGADITAISSASRSAIISNRTESLSALLTHMQHVDFVLVEGFKQEHYPKLMLLRNPKDEPLLQLSNIVMIASWDTFDIPLHHASPTFGISDFDAIYNHLLTLHPFPPK